MPAVLVTEPTVTQHTLFLPWCFPGDGRSHRQYSLCLPMAGWPGWVDLGTNLARCWITSLVWPTTLTTAPSHHYWCSPGAAPKYELLDLSPNHLACPYNLEDYLLLLISSVYKLLFFTLPIAIYPCYPPETVSTSDSVVTACLTLNNYKIWKTLIT